MYNKLYNGIMNDTTTVKVSKGSEDSTKALLDKLKIHPNQPYDEIIHKIAKNEIDRRGRS